MDAELNGWEDGWMDAQSDGWMEGWEAAEVDGWVDGWVGRWMDRQIAWPMIQCHSHRASSGAA